MQQINANKSEDLPVRDPVCVSRDRAKKASQHDKPALELFADMPRENCDPRDSSPSENISKTFGDEIRKTLRDQYGARADQDCCCHPHEVGP